MVMAERPEQFVEAMKADRRRCGDAVGRAPAIGPPLGPPLRQRWAVEPLAEAAAVIERPSQSATQSGKARAKDWRLRFERRAKPFHDPLTGWIGGSDPLAQIELRFPTCEAAARYAERHGLAYEIRKPPHCIARPVIKQAFQHEPPLALCCWPTGPHALCCGRYPLQATA